MWPMEKYISTRRKPSEAIRRRRKAGVSLSASASISAPALFSFWPLSEAPYPAFSTAEIIACGLAVPSTPIEFVKSDTEQVVTPSTAETAFSTRALHAAQLIPVT